MKTNLSSQIKLDRIPKKYYAPTSEIELASLTRNEKLNTKIFETPAEGAESIAKKLPLLSAALLTLLASVCWVLALATTQ